MGRDVTGLRIEKKPNNIVVKPNGVNHVSVFVAPKIAVERVDNSEVDQDHSTTTTTTTNGIVLLQDDGLHKKQDHVDETANSKSDSPDINVKSQKDESLKANKEKYSTSPVKVAATPKSTFVVALQATTHVPESSPSLAANEIKNSSLSDANGTAETETNDSTRNDHTHHKTNNNHHHHHHHLQSTDIKKNTEPLSPTLTKTVETYNDRKYDVDEEDNLSQASSEATSVRSARSKLTVPVAPTFRCGERLKRRKEYYTKLEVKNKVLEAERLEQETRIKEEEEAAIKHMRKSMVYKANPVPSFYHEGPPPKVELKKLPVTRPKSPNLTRRKSSSDAAKRHSTTKHVNNTAAKGPKREGNSTQQSRQKQNDVVNGSSGNKIINGSTRRGNINKESSKSCEISDNNIIDPPVVEEETKVIIEETAKTTPPADVDVAMW